MALSFDGNTILGTHFLNVGPLVYQRQENAIFGVRGKSVLVGEPEERMIVVESLIHDPDGGTQPELQAYLDDIDALVGTVGTLAETGDVARSFPNCEFMGFEAEPNSGQLPPSGTVTSWFIYGRLTFKQLIP